MAIYNTAKADKQRVREIISKSLEKQRLTLEETAVLVNASGQTFLKRSKKAPGS